MQLRCSCSHSTHRNAARLWHVTAPLSLRRSLDNEATFVFCRYRCRTITHKPTHNPIQGSTQPNTRQHSHPHTTQYKATRTPTQPNTRQQTHPHTTQYKATPTSTHNPIQGSTPTHTQPNTRQHPHPHTTQYKAAHPPTHYSAHLKPQPAHTGCAIHPGLWQKIRGARINAPLPAGHRSRGRDRQRTAVPHAHIRAPAPGTAHTPVVTPRIPRRWRHDAHPKTPRMQHAH